MKLHKLIPMFLAIFGFGGALGSFLYNQTMTGAAVSTWSSPGSPMQFFGLAFFLIGCLGIFLWRRK